MKEEILSNLDNPGQLEKLYRADKTSFRRAFNAVYPEVKDNVLVGFWNERLNFADREISWGAGKDLLFLIISCILAGTFAKLPAIFGIDEEFFYSRNAGFIVFPFLIAFFAWKGRTPYGKVAFLVLTTVASIIFINSLPEARASDTLVLSCAHLLFVLWSLLGFSFAGASKSTSANRLAFLRYNGDLVVMTTLIVIAGVILTGITIGLFALIGLNIERFYFENIVIFSLPAAPLFGTYLTQTNPQLVNKVSPVIAKIFSPLVLIMLVTYLGAIVYSGKNPYSDRDFLIIFNALLIGVMALIFFSAAGTSATTKTRWETLILLLLSVVTIVVNAIALSAIAFRISEWGITPNRAAVLGANILILVHLLLVTTQLFRVMSKKEDINAVSRAITVYLPVYFAWAAIVTFLFPFIFGFK